MSDFIEPILGFRFIVTFDTSNEDTDWQSVKGISKSLDTTVIHSGGDSQSAYYLPNHTVYEDLVLERGLISKNGDLYKWCQEMIDSGGGCITKIVPKTLKVALMDASYDSLYTWQFNNAYPVKMGISEFNAEKDAVVIDSMTFKFSSFDLQ
jgi:phage tail-like protein